VARLPWTTDLNPYQRALYSSLERFGVDLIGTGELSSAWLDRNRATVDVLHVHWKLHRLADRAPMGADRAAWVCDQLEVARDAGFTLAWTVHEPGLLEEDGDVERSTVERHLLEHADVAFTHDRATAQMVADLARRIRADRLPVTVTPLGDYRPLVEAGEPSEVVTAAMRRRLRLEDGARLVLAQGSLRVDKDLDLLVDAVGRLDRPDVALAIVGAIGDEPTRRFIDGVDRSRIRVLPEVLPAPSLRACYELAEVTVLARRRNWSSSSLLSAIAHGTPVVAADLPTHHEILGGNGATWCTPGDPDALAGAIARVLDDPFRARSTLLAARAHAARNSWDTMAERTAAAMRSAVSRRRDARGAAPAPVASGSSRV